MSKYQALLELVMVERYENIEKYFSNFIVSSSRYVSADANFCVFPCPFFSGHYDA
jgi:hypothetical protein